MFELRPYQSEFVTNIRQSLAIHKKIIGCMATGAGKSKVFISIAKASISKGNTVLIISESVKIYAQIKAEIENCDYIGEGRKEFFVERNKIYVAMAQTLIRRKGLITQFDNIGNRLLIINDEAHIGTATKVLVQIPNAYLIGFTATPHWQFAKHLPKLYTECVVGAQPEYLVEQGYLSKYRHFERRVIDKEKLKLKGGEYTEQSNEEAFAKSEVFDTLCDDLTNFEYKKCLIFCASIVQANVLHKKLKEVGFNCTVYHSEVENANYKLYQFTNEDVDICVSVSALTKGFDFPKIDMVILNRCTTSVPLYLQMCGRGSRIAPNKEYFTVLDYGENGSRIGLWNTTLDWAELWKPKKEKKRERKSSGVAPVQFCEKCGYLLELNKKICPNCGAVLKQKIELEKVDSVLVDLTEKYDAIKGKQISELSPEELYIYVQKNGKKAYGKRIAIAKGNDFLKEYAKLNKWKRGWNNYIQADLKTEFYDTIIR